MGTKCSHVYLLMLMQVMEVIFVCKWIKRIEGNWGSDADGVGIRGVKKGEAGGSAVRLLWSGLLLSVNLPGIVQPD